MVKVPTVELNNGKKMPVLGLGTWGVSIVREKYPKVVVGLVVGLREWKKTVLTRKRF